MLMRRIIAEAKQPRAWIVAGVVLFVLVDFIFPSGLAVPLQTTIVIVVCISFGYATVQEAKRVAKDSVPGKKKGFVRAMGHGTLWALFPAWKAGKDDAVQAFSEVRSDLERTASDVLPSTEEAERRIESFEDAMNRLGVTVKDLPRVEASWRFKAALYSFIADVFGAVLLGCLLSGAWMASFSSLSGFFIFYLLALVTHFRLDQIRQEELFPFKAFITKGGLKAAFNCLDW